MKDSLPQIYKKQMLTDLESFRQMPTVQNAIGRTPVYMAKNHMGENVLVALVVGIVSSELENFSVKQPMTEKMVYTFARQFVQNRTHDSVHDLIAMFEMVQAGHLSKHYGSIDVLKLNEWFNEYLEHKSYALENANAQMRADMWSESLSNDDVKRLKNDFKDVKQVESTNQLTTFEKWLKTFKNEFPEMDKQRQTDWIEQIKDMSVTSKSYEELYKWCIDNRI